MNADEVLRLLVDFFQVRACFDIADSIAEITVDPSWKLLPQTRLEKLLDLGRQIESQGISSSIESENHAYTGVSIPKSVHNSYIKNLDLLPDRSYGRHSRESHSVSCTPPIYSLHASFHATNQMDGSVPTEKKKPHSRVLNKKTDDKLQAWKEKQKEKQVTSIPKTIISSPNELPKTQGFGINKLALETTEAFPEGPGVFWMEPGQAEDAANSGSLPAGSPHVSNPNPVSNKTDDVNKNAVISKSSESEKATIKSKETPTQDVVDPMDFSSVNIVNNPDEELELFNLKIIFQKNHTGFEDARDFPITKNCIIAGRYEITHYLGSAAFSSAVQCIDRKTNKHVCIKVIKNTKDFFDQCLDEVKLLRYISQKGNPDDYNVLKLFDYFYYKEHLFIVTELLRDNLYEFYKFNRESGNKLYFTLGRLRKIANQCLVALQFIHSLDIIHCDLKPENILIKSYKKCQIKVIDFGSSCFRHDDLSTYVQSRSYRAPEVILGCNFDEKIDMWSLGCILGELYMGSVLFQNSSAATLLARIMGTIGPFPLSLLTQAKLKDDYMKNGKLFEKNKKGEPIPLKIVPTPLDKVLDCSDRLFLDFLTQLLKLDPKERISASDALNHPWILASYPEEPLDEDIYKDDLYESD
jgi:hypothetical protein